jgi:Transposase DDE domain
MRPPGSQRGRALAWAVGILDEIQRRGLNLGYCVADKAYDSEASYQGCERRGVRPIIAIRETKKVKLGMTEPPICPHGVWVFVGAEYDRGITKYRCPTGECRPAAKRFPASRLRPLIPHHTERWEKLYRRRTAVEGVVAHLKRHYGLDRPPVRGQPCRALRRLRDAGAPSFGAGARASQPPRRRRIVDSQFPHAATGSARTFRRAMSRSIGSRRSTWATTRLTYAKSKATEPWKVVRLNFAVAFACVPQGLSLDMAQ